jgi:hypothetical protein
MNPLAPPSTSFVGRGPLLRRLERLYRASRHVLLLGPPGAGKSMVLAELTRAHPMLIASHCGCLGDVLADLEPAAGLEAGELKLATRVHRALARLQEIGRPVVFENVARVPPKVAHFIRVLMMNQPVWLVARSALPLNLGHVWPYLFLFERAELPPFSPEETRAFLTAAEFPGDRPGLLASTLRLHRLAAGHPGTLVALVAELRHRAYDLRTAEGLRLLALHARITDVEAQLAADEPRLHFATPVQT